ncbi:MAG: hypothetical protein IAF94_03860 [Pirellulaceae bacterium]|nr:hypothetical protein [Pirellulaceae bacterium]
MSRPQHITALHIARITFALAAGMLLVLSAFSNSAEAGCGDYVFVRNASGQLVRASTLMPDHVGCTGPHCPDYHPLAIPTEAEPEPRGASPPLKRPCQGPGCSDRSQPPATPVPSSAPQRSQESTALLLRSICGDQQSGTRFGAVPSSCEHELHYPQFIFHPPR